MQPGLDCRNQVFVSGCDYVVKGKAYPRYAFVFQVLFRISFVW